MHVRFQNKETASSSPCALFCVLCLCVAVGVVAYYCGNKTEAPRRLWSPVVLEANGNETALGDSRQLNFWTPSAETKNYLMKDTNGEVAASDQWQVLANDDAVIQFGTLLRTNKSVLGYRRVPVWGQGSTGFKSGWWWTLTVLTNYTPVDFGNTYQSFWKSKHAVFVEVIDNRGRTE